MELNNFHYSCSILKAKSMSSWIQNFSSKGSFCLRLCWMAGVQEWVTNIDSALTHLQQMLSLLGLNIFRNSQYLSVAEQRVLDRLKVWGVSACSWQHHRLLPVRLFLCKELLQSAVPREEHQNCGKRKTDIFSKKENVSSNITLNLRIIYNSLII